ncbi:hypothetical protein [Shimia sediminis]|uniref:hypothetical protein n=1 Tax=Shimia sediminis TaxID=2497945 RepID=UPI000F8D7740|nr:hypothetical protein [Shimia sediminis]
MTSDDTHFDHEVEESDLLIAEFSKGEPAAAIYYVWCDYEKKRIGGYSGDLTVINNRASHHSRTYGHNTTVYRK